MAEINQINQIIKVSFVGLVIIIIVGILSLKWLKSHDQNHAHIYQRLHHWGYYLIVGWVIFGASMAVKTSNIQNRLNQKTRTTNLQQLHRTQHQLNALQIQSQYWLSQSYHSFQNNQQVKREVIKHQTYQNRIQQLQTQIKTLQTSIQQVNPDGTKKGN